MTRTAKYHAKRLPTTDTDHRPAPVLSRRPTRAAGRR